MISTSTSSFLFSIILITFYALRFLRCSCLSTDKASVSDHRGSCTAELSQNIKFVAQFGYWYHQIYLLTSARCGIFCRTKIFYLKHLQFFSFLFFLRHPTWFPLLIVFLIITVFRFLWLRSRVSIQLWLLPACRPGSPLNCGFLIHTVGIMVVPTLGRAFGKSKWICPCKTLNTGHWHVQ